MANDKENYLFIPAMEEFFKSKRKNDALVWIPVRCALLFSDDFQQLCTATKYIFVALMLLCGIRGRNEIPLRINYLTRLIGVNKRTMSKGIEELTGAKMLCQRERTETKESKEHTAQTAETRGESAGAGNAGVVAPGVDFRFSANPNQPEKNHALSQFSLEECLRYAELCKSGGDEIKSVKALAMNLFQTGKSDAFIRHALFPQKQADVDREIFGEPRHFTAEPCAICFGAKMEIVPEKGARNCVRCKNERGKSTGFEPEGEQGDGK